MQKVEEIKKTLTFYTLANKLKTTIVDEINNYSVADNIFGSMILAIAMDSEFKETDNLGKLLRMMLLDDFSKLNPNYPIQDILKKGKQYKEEIDEARSLQTKESKLIFKYKMLDYSLTQLITEQGNTLQYSDLLKEGIKIFRPKNSDEYSKYEEIFKFYYLNFKLKNKVRSGWDNKHWNINSERIERISEHIIGTIALAIVMDSEFDYNEEFDFDRNIEIDEIIKLLAIHEVGETLIGDITTFDGITPEQKKEMEHKAMIDAVGNLSDKDNLIDSLFDFDEQISNESRFAHFCNKIEADLQSKFYQDSGLHHSLDDQSNNCVFGSSKVQQMLKDGAQTAFDIWYGWDINIYKDSYAFPEFADMLKVVRDNNLFTLNNGVIKQKVELSEEEHKFLVDELGKVTKTLMEDDKVDCVYITNYQDQENDKGAICLVALIDNSAYYLDYELLAEKINENFQKINNTGIIVDFNYGHVTDYSVTALNPSDVHRVERLTESSIIFDKSGKTTEVRDRMKQYGHLYPFHLVEYRPPVDEPLILKLKK
ncbi:MAG: HD domain-containing protein [Bacilli bacterium]|nr:HD domain-containing protein [Bacilli bacterium]